LGMRSALPHQIIEKAWETCVLKAHGCDPKWSRKGNSNALSSQSRGELRRIDLHFHDLRHEGGTRQHPPVHHGLRTATRKSMLH
jgi:hypothetical protein